MQSSELGGVWESVCSGCCCVTSRCDGKLVEPNDRAAGAYTVCVCVCVCLPVFVCTCGCHSGWGLYYWHHWLFIASFSWLSPSSFMLSLILIHTHHIFVPSFLFTLCTCSNAPLSAHSHVVHAHTHWYTRTWYGVSLTPAVMTGVGQCALCHD